MSVPAPSIVAALQNALPPVAFLIWACYAVILLALRYRIREAPFVLSVATALVSTVFYSLQELPPLGDAAFLQAMYLSKEDRIWASEPITHLLLIRTLSPEILRTMLPPLMGFLSVLLWMELPLRDTAQRMHRLMLLASTPLQMVFFRGYFETMMIAVPVGLLFLHALLRFQRAVNLRGALTMSSVMGITLLVHGVYFFWLPVIPLVLLQSLETRKALSWSFLSVLTVIAVYAAGLILFWIAGFELDWMNAQGGGDGQAFVPFVADTANPFIAYTFGSLHHLLAVTSILVFASPFLPVLLLLRWKLLERSGVDFSILLLSAAFLGFVTIWNFDLGFFWDFDLIFSLSIPASLLTERLLSARVAPLWLSPFMAVVQTVLWMLAFSRFF